VREVYLDEKNYETERSLRVVLNLKYSKVSES